MERSLRSKVHYKYRSQLLTIPTGKVIKILMIGNNPREMGCLAEYLRDFTWKKFNVMATFSLEKGLRLTSFHKFDYILLDADLGHEALQSWIEVVTNRRSSDHTTIAVLKNEQTKQVFAGVHDYLIKDELNSANTALKVLNGMRIKLVKDRELLRQPRWKAWKLNSLSLHRGYQPA